MLEAFKNFLPQMLFDFLRKEGPKIPLNDGRRNVKLLKFLFNFVRFGFSNC